MKFRKRPIIVEAFQFRAYGTEVPPEFREAKIEFEDFNRVAFIWTLEGRMEVSDGDWIIKGVKGEFYPCKPDIFELTYERVNEGHQFPDLDSSCGRLEYIEVPLL